MIHCNAIRDGLRKHMIPALIDAKNSVLEVLTKEQLDAIKQWYTAGRKCTCGGGATPGAGPGYMQMA